MARRWSRCFRAAGGRCRGSGVCESRVVAAPAGLWARRAHEDRERRARVLSGVHHGKTIGSPIALMLENKDWQNWNEALPVEAGDPEKHKRVASPRPGHADLAGALKYDFTEARYVLERASARESAARVAIGRDRQAAAARVGHRSSESCDCCRQRSIAIKRSRGRQIAALARERRSAALLH